MHVVQAGDPQTLVSQLEGRIWRKVVAKADVAAEESRHRVISTRRVAGQMLLHVYADSAPDQGFSQAHPDLEDLYFFAMKAA